MGLLDRYLMRLKRPTPKDFTAVSENLREIERSVNILPIPAPAIYEIPIATLPYSALGDPLLVTFDFAVARPNTVICVDLFVNNTRTVAGGGEAEFRCGIDGVDIDTANRIVMNEAMIHASLAIGYVATLVAAGTHTLDLNGHKTINAGTFTYHGNLRLWVF